MTVHLEIYQAECVKVNNVCKETKNNYYYLKIEECGNDQEKMFSIGNELINNRKYSTLPTSGNPQELFETFVAFLTDKIAVIKESCNNETLATGLSEAAESPPVLNTLEPTSDLELRKIITGGNS